MCACLSLGFVHIYGLTIAYKYHLTINNRRIIVPLKHILLKPMLSVSEPS